MSLAKKLFTREMPSDYPRDTRLDRCVETLYMWTPVITAVAIVAMEVYFAKKDSE